jgi:hypothetical protein
MYLFLILALPNFFFLLIGGNSMAIPLSIFVLVLLPFYHKELMKVDINISTLILILIIFLSLIFGLYNNGIYSIKFKPIFSFGLILVLYVFILALINGLKNSELNFFYAYLLMLLIGVFGLLEIQPSFNRFYNKLVFPFSEPSHFNLAFGVISTAYIMKCKKNIYIPIFSGIYAIFFPSLSIAVLTIMQIFLIVRFKNFLFLFFLIIITLSLTNLSYFSDRLGRKENNASFLVYMQGWESIYETFINLRVFGMGFQQMGLFSTTPIGDFLCNEYSFCSNNFDGSFLLSKLVTEFGIIGILFSLILSFYSVLSFFVMRKNLKFKNFLTDYQILGHSFIYNFLIELFVRGYGYFSFNLIATVIFIQLHGKLKNNEK